MTPKRTRAEIHRACRDGKAIDEAMRQGAIQAFINHSWTGTPLSVWRNGRVEHIDPNDPNAPIPPDFPPPRSRPPVWPWD